MRLLDDAWSTNGEPSPRSSRIVSVRSGDQVTVPGGSAYGWTPDGHTLSVDTEKDEVTVCDPETGSCDRIHVEIGSEHVKLGGLSYES